MMLHSVAPNVYPSDGAVPSERRPRAVIDPLAMM